MERIDGAGEAASIVLATVKGDVHDIGKNLVDIILTNNGYKRRQSRHQAADRRHDRCSAAKDHRADADRHVRPPGQIHRRDARKSRGDDAPGRRQVPVHARAARPSRAAMSRRIACKAYASRPRRLCARRLRWPRTSWRSVVSGNGFDDAHPALCRPRMLGQARATSARKLGASRRCQKPLRPVDVEEIRLRERRQRVTRDRARGRCRPSGARAPSPGVAGQGAGALPQRAHASTNSSGAIRKDGRTLDEFIGLGLAAS